jgi:hypothetical protein
MRRLCTLFAMMTAAAALSAQNATPSSAASEPRPQLVQSVAEQPGDSPLVRAAKRAVARRQNAKNRITITGAAAGHISQGTGTLKPIVVPPEPAPARTNAIDPNVIRARNEMLEQQIRTLEDEKTRLGAETDEPVGGDGPNEDAVVRRITDLQQKIDALRKQQKDLAVPPPR